MNNKTIALALSLCAALAACGGDEGSADADTLGAGQSTTIAQGQTLHVPADTVVTSNGNTVTITGHQDTLHVAAGAVVSVQADASGAADNLVIAD